MLRITDPDDLPRILWRLGVSYYADGTYTDPATGCAYTYFKAVHTPPSAHPAAHRPIRSLRPRAGAIRARASGTYFHHGANSMIVAYKAGYIVTCPKCTKTGYLRRPYYARTSALDEHGIPAALINCGASRCKRYTKRLHAIAPNAARLWRKQHEAHTLQQAKRRTY